MNLEKILVVDSDADIRRFIEVNLRLEGFEVLQAGNGVTALNMAFEQKPAMVLLDVLMPGMDGIEVCRQLRADPRTTHIPILMLTAKSTIVDKVVGLAAGADDYVLKPFDPMELVARVQTTLRRAADLRGSSPLTGLPGNHRIEAEIQQRLQSATPIAVAYVDLNDFKSYNDHYGFLAGDTVIQQTAQVLRDALTTREMQYPFLGHIGGDDFVMVFDAEHIDAVCQDALDRFDVMIPSLYALEDLKRGYVEVKDRRGDMQRFARVSMAIGLTSSALRTFDDHREIVLAATEMKSFVKSASREKSSYAIDARTAEV